MRFSQNLAFVALTTISSLLACSSNDLVDGDEEGGSGDVGEVGSGGSDAAAGGSTFDVGGGAVGAGGNALGAGGFTFGVGGGAVGAGGNAVNTGGGAVGAGGAGAGDGGTGSGGVADGTGGSDGTQTDGEIYYEAVCAECHGPTGDGIDGVGPDIKHPVEAYSEFIIRNGRTAHPMYEDDMPDNSLAKLPDALLRQIFDLLANQPQPTDGQGLFEDYCLACHGADARGGTTTRSLEMHVNDVAKLVRSGHAGAYDDRLNFMPSWTAQQLTDAEVDLLSQYVKSLFGQ